MTNSEKQMAKELYHMMGYDNSFSMWEQDFIENLYHKPYYDCLTYRQRMYLEKLWKDRIGFPQARPCVFPLDCVGYRTPPKRDCYIQETEPARNAILIGRLENTVRSMSQEIQELKSAIDRLTNGQSVLFRDVEALEETAEVTNERLVQMEAFAEEFE